MRIKSTSIYRAICLETTLNCTTLSDTLPSTALIEKLYSYFELFTKQK